MILRVVDDCRHSFQDLAGHVLPSHMARMHEQLKSPHPLTAFLAGRKSALRHIARTKDFSGCYVLIEKGQPHYVGISRKVVSRLSQHVTSKSHFSASLAYRMACHENQHKLRRAEAMSNEGIMLAFNKSQGRLREMAVAFVEIDCPVELYLFEVYAALELETHQWNSFRTH